MARELIRSITGTRNQAVLMRTQCQELIKKCDQSMVDFEALIRAVEETEYTDKRPTQRPPRKR